MPAQSLLSPAQIRPFLNRYGELPDPVLQKLIDNSRYVASRRKEQIILQGDYNDHAYLILKGTVRAYHLVEGREFTDWFALPGMFFSAISSFFQDRPSTHFYEALRKTESLQFSRSFLLELANQHHEVERMLRHVITESFLTLQDRLIYHRGKSAAFRYADLARNRPEWIQEIPLKYIASYLGITPETLSRIRTDYNS